MTTAPEQHMDQAEDQTEDWGPVPPPAVTYPEPPDNPHNHTFTWSPKLADGSMLVIRANTGAELLRAAQEAAGVAQQLSSTWSDAKVIHQSYPAPPQQQYPQAQQAPNMPYQGQPPWQTAGAPQGGYQAPAPQLPAGWHRLNVPFKSKPQFDAIVAQYNLRKADPGSGGQVSFQKANKTWYCAPDVVGAFQQFQPVPA